MTYEVRHRTEYRYESVVSASYGEIHLLPRDVDGQTVRSAKVEIDPAPGDYRERSDIFGNRVAYFSILDPHDRLTVTSTSVVEVEGRGAVVERIGTTGWETTRDLVADSDDGEALDARQYLLSSPHVALSPAVAAYASTSFPAGRNLLDATRELMTRIHADFEFKPGATSVTTSVDEVLAKKAGVCQDFAHLAIACLRSVGLAARYVSGYLETEPPPGTPRLVGADVSHAWASVLVTGVGWLDLDPTNDQFVGDRYVTIGWGRDYGDVPPLKGVIFTEGEHNELEVIVDVLRVETDGDEASVAAPAG